MESVVSAEKCGTAMTIEMFRESSNACEPPVLPSHTIAMSGQAYKMLDKIKKIHPEWEPKTPHEVWSKARSLGLLDEEE
jgi:hypothetical protein